MAFTEPMNTSVSWDRSFILMDDSVVEDDETNDGVHSTSIYAVVKENVENKRFHHMRALAGHIADVILADFTSLAEVTVKARKANATLTGPIDYIEVEVTRKAK